MSQTTVFDCVLLGRKPYIRWAVGEEDLRLCTAMIHRVGLEALELRSLDELSGGELQKVMLARALVQRPKVLLLDEPTSNLDHRNQYEMMDLVREVAREQHITVLIVLHDLNLALRYCCLLYTSRSSRRLPSRLSWTPREATSRPMPGILPGCFKRGSLWRLHSLRRCSFLLPIRRKS